MPYRRPRRRARTSAVSSGVISFTANAPETTSTSIASQLSPEGDARRRLLANAGWNGVARRGRGCVRAADTIPGRANVNESAQAAIDTTASARRRPDPQPDIAQYDISPRILRKASGRPLTEP
jgi:hypothetical protein